MKYFVVPGVGDINYSEFCTVARIVLQENDKEYDVLPLIGCGDGFVKNISDILGAETLLCRVTDGNFFIKNIRYGVKDDTAIIGVTECCGLSKTMIKNPLYTTSYGVGEVISLAKKLNKKHIIIGLDGGATNDCGAGVVCALGGKFFDKSGEEITPVGNTLSDIDKIDLTEFYKNIAGMDFTVLTDDITTLLGERSCSFVTAPTKKASSEEVALLDKNVQHFVEKTSFLNLDDFSGAGAGGGLGYCFKGFFNAKILSGFEYFLKVSKFYERLQACDVVLTSGKVSEFVKNASEKLGKKVFVFDREGSDDTIGIDVEGRNDNDKNIVENLSAVMTKVVGEER